MSTPLKRLAVPVPVAAILLGTNHETVYQRVRDGSLPRLPLPGRWRISIAALERIADRAITTDEIDTALEIYAAKRAVTHERWKKARADKAAKLQNKTVTEAQS